MDDREALREAALAVLEKNGVVAKLKAELRAAIYDAIRDKNDKAKDKMRSLDDANSLEFELVREFLEHHRLKSALAVFDSEVESHTHNGLPLPKKTRRDLAKKIGLCQQKPDQSLLAEVVRLSRVSILAADESEDDTLKSSSHVPKKGLSSSSLISPRRQAAIEGRDCPMPHQQVSNKPTSLLLTSNGDRHTTEDDHTSIEEDLDFELTANS